MAFNFSTAKPEARKSQSDALKILKRNDFQPRILYSEKLLIKCEGKTMALSGTQVSTVLSPCTHSQEAVCPCAPLVSVGYWKRGVEHRRDKGNS